MKVPKVAYAVAILLAVLAGAAVYFFQSTADQRALAGKQAVTVLVAFRDIPKNTTLADIQANGLAKLESYPVGSVPADALESFTDADSTLVATHRISRGEILNLGSFGDAVTSVSGIQIPDGKVAATFDLGEAERMSGFVLPGSQIAVLYTYKDAKGDTFTRVLLSRVTVLAVGTTTDVANDSTTTGQPSMITLALTQKEAEAVVLAKKTGDITFALLGTDSNLVPDSGTSENGIRG